MRTDLVTYRPGSAASSRATRVMVAIWAALCIALVIIAFTAGRWAQLATQLPLMLAVPATHWLMSRRTYRADTSGIHARFIMDEPWSSIESVKAPTPWDVHTMVCMADTGEERSTGFPASYASALAEVGGRPVR